MSATLASSLWADFIVYEWDEKFSSLVGFCSSECVDDYIQQFNPEYFASNVQVSDVRDDLTHGQKANGCEHA